MNNEGKIGPRSINMTINNGLFYMYIPTILIKNEQLSIIQYNSYH